MSGFISSLLTSKNEFAVHEQSAGICPRLAALFYTCLFPAGRSRASSVRCIARQSANHRYSLFVPFPCRRTLHFAATTSPSLPNRSQGLRMRRSIIRTVVHRKHICRAPLPCSLLFPGNFRYLYNAPSQAYTDCQYRQIAASSFDKSDESPS